MLGVDNATSEVVHHFLRSLTVKVSRTTVYRLLDNPLGNTMQGISHALDALHVKNAIRQLRPTELEKLNVPFLTQLETSHSTFCLVEKIERDYLIITTPEARHLPMSRRLFRYQCTGTALVGEATPETISEPHCLLRNADFICRQHRTLIAGMVCLLLAFSTVWSKNHPGGLTGYLLSLTCGILVSSAILYKEVADSHFLHRLCHIGKSVNCTDVLHSKGARIAGIGIGELSWIYFTTMFFFTAVCPEEFHCLAALFGIIAIAFTLYSVIYQVFIIRKACPLCILTTFMVWTAAAMLYAIRGHYEWKFSIRILFSLIAVGTICLICWVQAKALVTSDKEKDDLKAQLSGLLNPSTFQKLLSLKPKIRGMIHPDIAIHNTVPNSKNRLMVVINPNCKVCAQVHRHLRDIPSSLCISLVISTNDRLGEHVAQTILSAYFSEGWQKATQLLESWYETREIPGIENYYITRSIKDIWQQQQDYCQRNAISHTPAVIINGHYMPSVYHLPELKYVLILN